jgi:hypothetical protein
VSGGRIAPAPVALTAPASDRPAPVGLSGPAIDRNVQAPVGLSGPAIDRNVQAPVGLNVLRFVQNVLPPVDPSGRLVVPNAQAQLNVRAISNDRKLRGHDLKHDRNIEHVRGKERGHASTRVQDHSSGPVLSRVQVRTDAAAATNGHGHKEVRHPNEMLVVDRVLIATQSPDPRQGGQWSPDRHSGLLGISFIGAMAASRDSAVDQTLKGSSLLGLGLANVVGIVTAIATNAISPFAFIHKITVAIAFSKLRPALRRHRALRSTRLRGMPGRCRRHQN